MLIDLESIQQELSSDYSLNMYFSRRFPYIDGPSFSPYKPLQNVDFSKVDKMQFSFQELYSRIDKNSVCGYVSRQNSKKGNLLNCVVIETALDGMKKIDHLKSPFN